MSDAPTNATSLQEAQWNRYLNEVREWLRGYENSETWASCQLAANLLRPLLAPPAATEREATERSGSVNQREQADSWRRLARMQQGMTWAEMAELQRCAAQLPEAEMARLQRDHCAQIQNISP